jgi:hypothetical protein
MFGLEKEQHRNGKIPGCVHYPVGWFLNCPSWIKHGPSAPSFAVRFRNQSCVASETDQKPTEAWLRNQKIWFRNHNVWFRNQNFPQRTQNEPFWTRCYICIFGITKDQTGHPLKTLFYILNPLILATLSTRIGWRHAVHCCSLPNTSNTWNTIDLPNLQICKSNDIETNRSTMLFPLPYLWHVIIAVGQPGIFGRRSSPEKIPTEGGQFPINTVLVSEESFCWFSRSLGFRKVLFGFQRIRVGFRRIFWVSQNKAS